MNNTIEEMAKIIMGAIPETNYRISPANEEEALTEAEALYKAGYRKTCTSEFTTETEKAYIEGYGKGFEDGRRWRNEKQEK